MPVGETCHHLCPPQFPFGPTWIRALVSSMESKCSSHLTIDAPPFDDMLTNFPLDETSIIIHVVIFH